jgi:hypothetical protein
MQESTKPVNEVCVDAANLFSQAQGLEAEVGPSMPHLRQSFDADAL